MRLLACAAVALALLAGAGCNGSDDDSEVGWDGPPQPNEAGVAPVEGFVEYQQSVEEAWEGSAAMAASEFLRLDGRTAATTTIQDKSSPEGTGPSKVTVLLDGLGDDSVRSEVWALEFTVDGDAYVLSKASRAVRCQPGRGHQDYSPALCT
jgi:hypothetical protein